MIRHKRILILYTFLFLIFIIGGAMYSSYFIRYPVLGHISQQLQYGLDAVLNNSKSNINDKRESYPPAKNIIAEQNADKLTGTKREDTVRDSANHLNDKIATESNNQPPVISSINPAAITEDNNSPTLPSQEVAKTIQQEVGKPIEPSDLFQAVSIILRKLSEGDIKFLLGFSGNNYTNEEFIEIRKLLLSKLSTEDITILKALAQKYDRDLEIFDPDIMIE